MCLLLHSQKSEPKHSLAVNSVYTNAPEDLRYSAVRMTPLLPEILQTFKVPRLSETMTFVMDAH